jgi:TRAP-type C4-dicarboxylate transport system permease small subunit
MLLGLLQRICLYLRAGVSALVIVLFTVMMISVLVQVGGRYVFNYSIAAASEIATFSQIWLVLMGAGVAIAKGQHVAIDVVPAKLPLRLARVALISITLVVLAFLAVLGWGSMSLLRMGAFQTSPTMQLPMKYIYMCLPAGATYMALELLLSMLTRWNNPFPLPEPDEEEAI